MGFFSPGNSRRFYIGIWFRKISKQTIIWVANRNASVSNTSSSELGISVNGNLVLKENSTQVWSSNSKSFPVNSSTAVLLDTGNLVLRDRANSSSIIWQSFDHPTDTLIPESWLGVNKITGEYQSLTSWKNTEDPSPGLFTEGLDQDGINQFVLKWNGTETYWQSGVWNGNSFSLVMGMSESAIMRFHYVNNKERRYFTSTKKDNNTIMRNVIDPSGQMRQWLWLPRDQNWMLIWSAPNFLCDIYSGCGIFGICHQDITNPCICAPGFEPVSVRDWSMNVWSNGCRRKTQLQCGHSSSMEEEEEEEDGFLMIQNMKFPANPQSSIAGSVKVCRRACINNCSCTAYAYVNNSCLIWVGDILNIQQLSKDEGGSLYLRLAASELARSGSKKNMVMKIMLAAAIGLALSIIAVLTWSVRRNKLRGTWKSPEGTLVPFTYSELQRATKNFSEKLGAGGFGSVFKGLMTDSTIVAVKRLEGLRQGEKQFRTEVSILGTIQHVNLVHLRGFCCKGTDRLLVYEYMPNGSLDHHLFRNSSRVLDWKTRYCIILGIAKGLGYLHEKCREKIIHCDVKPENILLDADFSPKVSDFGMSKFLGRDFSRVLTTLRGTIGYLAPEWISGLPITPNVDVYSYGMMLFEIVSGRRNTEQRNHNYFPVWAAERVIEGEVMSLLDKRLNDDADIGEVTRVCKAACWCIQDSEAHRPSMERVVQMLEGVIEVRAAPIPLSLQYFTNIKDSICSS